MHNMEQWHIVLMGMDVIMLIWLSREAVVNQVLRKSAGVFVVYATVMTAGCLYFLWSMSELCGGCNG